jgi:hypothetical protein
MRPWIGRQRNDGSATDWSQAARSTFQPDWRRDLNCPTCRAEKRCVNSAQTADLRAALFELNPEAATPVRAMRKPFGIPAEGLLSKNSRGDWI